MFGYFYKVLKKMSKNCKLNLFKEAEAVIKGEILF